MMSIVSVIVVPIPKIQMFQSHPRRESQFARGRSGSVLDNFAGHGSHPTKLVQKVAGWGEMGWKEKFDRVHSG